MAFSKTFERGLNNLFQQRTDWLRRKLGKIGAGKPPEFGRKKVDEGIHDLQAIASDALAHKLAKSEFEEHVAARKNYHITGHGPDDKKEKFEKWFSAKFPKTKGLIYAFWGNHNRCIYIGARTWVAMVVGPSSHFEKYWFAGVGASDNLRNKRKSHIPKLECLAIHHFQPSRSKNKALYEEMDEGRSALYNAQIHRT